MNDRPQDIGFKFERDFAKRIGGRLTPGSGNQWYAKLDVKGNSFLWSLKATSRHSFRITQDLMRETVKAVEGIGGAGGDTVPGVAIRMADEDYVLLRIDDFIHLVEDEVKLIEPTKKKQRMARGMVPKLLRKEDDG